MRGDDRSLAPVVVKVGGSLFTLPDLGPRLKKWLKSQMGTRFLFVPGGGPTADVIRSLDERHSLGEESSHWLALRALTLNAEFLAALLQDVPGQVVQDLADCPELWSRSILPILDPHAFAKADEGRPGSLPHYWSVSSDSVAARVAVVCRASELVLLKSVTIPKGMGWEKACEKGFVDGFFPMIAANLSPIQSINFRMLSDE